MNIIYIRVHVLYTCTKTLIETETNKRGLYINEDKTKYMTIEGGRKQVSVREMQRGD